MTVKEIKREARKKYSQNRENMISVSLIYMCLIFISFILSSDFMPYICYVLWLMCFYFMGPADIGKASLCLQTIGINSGCSADLFRYFGDEGYGKCKWAYFYKYALVSLAFFGFCGSVVISALWLIKGSPLPNHRINLSAYSYILMALFVTGFIVLFVVMMAKYIFLEYITAEKCEEPNIKYYSADEVTEAINGRNELLMSGNFKAAVKFVLSFWLEFLLSIITFGLGFIILIPYFNTAAALFYAEERDKFID